MFFMPESPPYLVSKDRDDEALEALKRLRGPNYDHEKELEQLREDNRKQHGSVSVKEFLTDGVYLKPFLVVMGLMFFQQFAGINAVIFYTSFIFIQAGSEMDEGIARICWLLPYFLMWICFVLGLSAFLVALAQFLATFVAVLIVERFGRKILLLVSSVFMSLSLFALGTYFYMIDEDKADKFDQGTVDDLGWLPLVSLMTFIISFSIGNHLFNILYNSASKGVSCRHILFA